MKKKVHIYVFQNSEALPPPFTNLSKLFIWNRQNTPSPKIKKVYFF